MWRRHGFAERKVLFTHHRLLTIAIGFAFWLTASRLIMRFIVIFYLILIVNSSGAAEKLILMAGTEKAPLKEPFGLDFTAEGKIIIAEFGAHRITQVDPDGKLTIRAGDGTKGDLDGPALKAKFNGPHNLVIAKNGDIYVADTFNHKVRKIDAKTGDVTTIAGTGKKGFSGDDGPATKAEFDQTYHVVIDPTGAVAFRGRSR